MIWKVGIWNLVMLTLVTLAVFSLPFWNPSPMNLGEKIIWWIVFGGGTVWIWVIRVRGRLKDN